MDDKKIQIESIEQRISELRQAIDNFEKLKSRVVSSDVTKPTSAPTIATTPPPLQSNTPTPSQTQSSSTQQKTTQTDTQQTNPLFAVAANRPASRSASSTQQTTQTTSSTDVPPTRPATLGNVATKPSDDDMIPSWQPLAKQTPPPSAPNFSPTPTDTTPRRPQPLSSTQIPRQTPPSSKTTRLITPPPPPPRSSDSRPNSSPKTQATQNSQTTSQTSRFQQTPPGLRSQLDQFASKTTPPQPNTATQSTKPQTVSQLDQFASKTTLTKPPSSKTSQPTSDLDQFTDPQSYTFRPQTAPQPQRQTKTTTQQAQKNIPTIPTTRSAVKPLSPSQQKPETIRRPTPSSTPTLSSQSSQTSPSFQTTDTSQTSLKKQKDFTPPLRNLNRSSATSTEPVKRPPFAPETSETEQYATKHTGLPPTSLLFLSNMSKKIDDFQAADNTLHRLTKFIEHYFGTLASPNHVWKTDIDFAGKKYHGLGQVSAREYLLHTGGIFGNLDKKFHDDWVQVMNTAGLNTTISPTDTVESALLMVIQGRN